MKSVKLSFLAVALFAVCNCSAQMGVGIAIPDASSILDLTSTNKGLLIPRIALTATNSASPVTAPTTSLLVYNTATASSGSTVVTPGYYHWNGSSWIRHTDNGWIVAPSAATTNFPGATGYFGTADNNSVFLTTNGQVRGSLTNLGEFFIGTTSTALTGDLMAAQSNTSFPWANSGYSGFNGSGVYGSITAGTTVFAGVQGEYYGTGAFNTAAVRGLNANTVPGTGFRVLAATGPRVGVVGSQTGTTGSYSFGLHGSFSSIAIRCGAVFGDDFGISAGGLGYYASTGVDYGIYGFGNAYQAGTGAGRGAYFNNTASSLDTNTNIGIGIYGGMMGGWVRGLKYGLTTKGETYGLYVDGKGYTNEPMTYLMPTATDERVASYMVTSMEAEVNAKGRALLQAGKVYVAFDDHFKKVITGKPEDIMITATPQGNSGGVYINNITADGFWIVENNNGGSTVQVVWMATAAVKSGQPETAPELLNKDFDRKMNNVMYNDNDTKGTPQNMWWDGTKMRWDTPPVRVEKVHAVGNARPQGNK